MGQQTEGVGVALEVGDIVPEGVAHLTLQVASGPFGEIGLDGFLTTVAEGRIAHVVGQAGGRYDLSDLCKERVTQFRMTDGQLTGHIVA